MKFPQNYLPVEAQTWVKRMEDTVAQLQRRNSVLVKNMTIQQEVTSAQGESSGRISEVVDEILQNNLDTMEVVEEIKQTAEEAIREAQLSNEEARDALESIKHVSDRSEVWIGDTPPIGEFAGENIARAPQGQTNEGIQPQPLPGGSFTYNYNPTLQVPNTPTNVSRALLMQKNGINQDDVVALGRGLAIFTPGIDDYYAGFYITTKLALSGPDADLFFEEFGYSVPYELRVYVEIDSGDPDMGTWQEEILPPTQLNMTQPRPYDEEIPEQDLGEQSWHWVSLDRPVPQGSQVYIELRFLGDLSTFDITGSTTLTMISGITARHDRKVNPLDFFDGSFESNSLYDYHWSGVMGRSASYRTLAVQNDRVLWINTTDGANMPMTWNPVTNQWEETQDADIAQAAQDAAQAAQDAQAALDAATSKNEIIHAITAPIGDGEAVGDMWMRHAPDIDGPVDGWWTWTGTNWVPMELRNEVIANLDAGKITSGTIDANRIGANTITADKLQIGDFNSYWLDPKLLSVDVGQTISNLTVVASDHPDGLKAFQWFSAGNSRLAPTTLADLFGYTLGVSQGDEFVMTYDRKILSGSVGTIRPYFYSGHPGSGTLLGTGTTVSTEVENLANGWERVTWIVRATYASASYATWFFGKDSNGEVLLTNPYLYKRNSAVLIQDGAVTAPKILAGAVEAEKIATNAVRTQHLEANSVVASKLSISDFTNLIADAELRGTSFGAATSNAAMVYDWNARVGSASSWTFQNSTTYNRSLRLDTSMSAEQRLVNGYEISVQEGDEFLLEWEGFRSSGGAAISVGIMTYQLDGTFVGWNTIGSSLSNTTWQSGSGSITITGANARIGRFVIQKPIGYIGTFAEFAGLRLRRKSGGKLIVDGAITADKVAANAVTTDKLQANAITAKHTITGALFQTDARIQRGVKIDSSGLKAWVGDDSVQRLKFSLDSNTGEVLLLGDVYTGHTDGYVTALKSLPGGSGALVFGTSPGDTGDILDDRASITGYASSSSVAGEFDSMEIGTPLTANPRGYSRIILNPHLTSMTSGSDYNSTSANRRSDFRVYGEENDTFAKMRSNIGSGRESYITTRASGTSGAVTSNYAEINSFGHIYLNSLAGSLVMGAPLNGTAIQVWRGTIPSSGSVTLTLSPVNRGRRNAFANMRGSARYFINCGSVGATNVNAYAHAITGSIPSGGLPASIMVVWDSLNWGS